MSNDNMTLIHQILQNKSYAGHRHDNKDLPRKRDLIRLLNTSNIMSEDMSSLAKALSLATKKLGSLSMKMLHMDENFENKSDVNHSHDDLFEQVNLLK